MLSEEKMTKNFTFSEKWTFPWCCQYHAKAANGHSIQKHSQHSQSVPALHESVNFSTVEEERIRASTSSNVSISLLTDAYVRMQNTDLLIVCLRKRGHKSLRLHTILFPSVCYFIVIVWMITIINIEKKSVQGIISFHEYIIIMNIGQSILITERVSFFF